MIEALWSVEFKMSATQVTGAGVVIFESQRIFGGDSNYFYTGDYSLDGNDLTANIKVTHYNGEANNVFGTGREIVSLNVKGTLEDNSFTASAYMIDESKSIDVILTKRSELP